MLYVKGFLVALEGVPVTVGVTLFALALGVLLGLLLALMKLSRSRVLRCVSGVYVEVIRGTPMIVQALIMAYGLPQLLQHLGTPFKWPYLIIPALIVCGGNSAAYVAEVIRGGIQAVDRSQTEAALSLGMTRRQAMRLIILPQALKIVLPALGNEFVTLIKETSVLSYVGVVEILRKGALWNAATFHTFQAYIGVALVYLLLTYPTSRLVRLMERKLAAGAKAP
ncbi:MAG: amino acid ABC transporter permease [Ruminococcaceae bacterium]|jgi:His/Glu/Gln/Arg/opine family amino acid ABC transporter permease subunit|nr:amino acid ABC transporter permease [Oscillospiraceae bacterium]